MEHNDEFIRLCNETNNRRFNEIRENFVLLSGKIDKLDAKMDEKFDQYNDRMVDFEKFEVTMLLKTRMASAIVSGAMVLVCSIAVEIIRWYMTKG